jgi:hypothetical protein
MAAEAPSAAPGDGVLNDAPALAAESPIRTPADTSSWLLNPAVIRPAPVTPLARPYLTTEEKLQHYLRDTFSPNAQLSSTLNGVFNQFIDGSSDWGSGAEGYSSRIGSKIGTRVVRNSMRVGLDVAFGMDSRYRRSESDEFWPRLGHALLSTVVAHKDDGTRTFAAPHVFSTYGAAFVTNTWYPTGNNSSTDALLRGTTCLGWSAGKNVLKEFWPDIKKLFGK